MVTVAKCPKDAPQNVLNAFSLQVFRILFTFIRLILENFINLIKLKAHEY